MSNALPARTQAASAHRVKPWILRPGICAQGTFLNNALQSQKAIVNCMAINEDGVMATGGDDGSLWCGAHTRLSPYTP